MTVHVVGSINIDIIARVAALPKPGETVLALESTRLAGGKGANQAVAAARMGAACRMVGAVGADEGGGWIREIIASYGVEISGIAQVQAATGAAHIAVDSAGENQIIVLPGANAHVVAEPVDGGILLAQLEVPVQMLTTLFAASPSARRILNAAPPTPAALALLPHVDILIVNEHELAALAPGPSAPDQLRSLLTRPDQFGIVTLGAKGLLAVWPDRELFVPAWPVNAQDTIGAGDCFCGSLAALLDAGTPVEQALPLAAAAAALCTLKPGAAPAMPTRAEVDAFIASAPR
ncbi:ribokinase [Sandaracinobacter neustonicus]|uniref:Ribokinase n=1 Tax=Sandaracinobacter neustonicus TaxID=1715348 RepID=A0A501XPH8_9SPHN|nr:PfkB family carbohydrate kinase [Sandaracinobacter neustonicus]TPE62203.1 ribokinase [Sandaracinobacter neustonicus]